MSTDYLTTEEKARIETAAHALEAFQRNDSWVVPEVWDAYTTALQPKTALKLLAELAELRAAHQSHHTLYLATYRAYVNDIDRAWILGLFESKEDAAATNDPTIMNANEHPDIYPLTVNQALPKAIELI